MPRKHMARELGTGDIATKIQQHINNMMAQGITADSIRENILKDTQHLPTQEAYHK